MPFGQSLTAISSFGPLIPAAGSLAGRILGGTTGGILLEKGFDILADIFRPAPEVIFQRPGGEIQPFPTPSQQRFPPSLPPGSTGTGLPALPGAGPVGPAGMSSTRSLATTGFTGATGLWHVTPCGNIAANQVAFETTADRQGNPVIFGAAVKRISMAKLKRHILAQVRSTGRRHHHHPVRRRHHHHHRRRPRR